MTRPRAFWAAALALTALAWLASALLYPRLPAVIPIHWDMRGRVDGFGPRAMTLFLFPGFMVGMLGFFRVLPALSPKDFEVDSFRATYLLLMVGVIGLFAYLHGVILLATWQHVTNAPHPVDLGRWLFSGLFLVLALIGNVLGKVRRNFYIGVRVPWTLASERVWNDTHRLAAWTFVAGSLVGFVAAVTGLPLAIPFAALGVAVLVPVVYSFVHYKRLERRGAL